MSLGEFEQVLLFALHHLGDGADGAAVRREIGRRTGSEPAPGALYTALTRLEERGFVRSQIVEGGPQRGGSRRKIYAMRPDGARALAESFARIHQMSRGATAELLRLAEESR